MSGRIDFTLGFNAQGTSQQRSNEQGYRIYIIGNFSGHAELPWRERKINRIDMDSFDKVMARIEPKFSADSGMNLQFQSLDDFHPDAWLHNIPVISDLLRLKKELATPNTAEQAAAKIQALYQPAPSDKQQPQQAAVTETKDDMLDRLLGSHSTVQQPQSTTVDKLIDKVVSPYVKKESEPQHEFLRGVIDTMIGQFLKTVLHQPDFQRIEALWRATEDLVNEENADDQQFFLVDITPGELHSELQTGGQSFAEKLFNHIQTDEDNRGILLIGDLYFGANQDDKALLAYAGNLAKTCNGRFIGCADASLIENTLSDNDETQRNWQQTLAEAGGDNLLLSYPRYLQRLPYGDKRDALDTLPFEECSAIPENGELLWSNPAFLCARALIKPDESPERLFFNDVCVFSYQQDGEAVLQAGAETVLNESRANALLDHGVIPVIGFRQRQGVRLLALTALNT